MLGLLGMLFIASSTDVLANFFHISLNNVLWAMRFLVVITPFICYFVTYMICKEMQALPEGGKRKVANIVTMTAEGEYVATPAPPPPGTDLPELEPEVVPRYIESDEGSTARGARGAAGEPVVVPPSSVRTVER
jgi:hypothetical protein